MHAIQDNAQIDAWLVSGWVGVGVHTNEQEAKMINKKKQKVNYKMKSPKVCFCRMINIRDHKGHLRPSSHLIG